MDRTDPAVLAAGLQVVLADEADRRRVVAAGPAAVRAAFCDWCDWVGLQQRMCS